MDDKIYEFIRLSEHTSSYAQQQIRIHKIVRAYEFIWMKTTMKHTISVGVEVIDVAQGGFLLEATFALTGEDAAFLFLLPSFAALAATAGTTAASTASTAPI